MNRIEILSAIGGARDRYELWASLLSAIPDSQVLEIGVWEGAFARYMLEKVPGIARYYMLDPWRPLSQWNKPLNRPTSEMDRAFDEAKRAVAFAAERVNILRGTTTEVIDQIPDESLDFVYIDGDHTLRGVTIDLVRSYTKVRPGGIVGGDDFFANAWRHGPQFEPTFVFPFAVYFAEAMGAEIIALPFDQFLIRKPANGGAFVFRDSANSFPDTSVLRAMQNVARRSFLDRTARKLRLLFMGNTSGQ